MNWLKRLLEGGIGTFGRYFRRSVKSDSEELEDFITEWTKNVGCKPFGFCEVLSEMGVKLPIWISNLDRETRTFDCVSGEEIFRMRLNFSDHFDQNSGIDIIQKEKVISYDVMSKDGKLLWVLDRTVTWQGVKKLKSKYYGSFLAHELWMDESHFLLVRIDEPRGEKKQKAGERVLYNREKIEDYLIGLTHPVSAQEVYQEMVCLLALSEEEIQECDEILVSYNEISYNEFREQEYETKTLVRKEKGKMKEYAIWKNYAMFCVWGNGNWKYSSQEMTIVYQSKKDRYQLYMESALIDSVWDVSLREQIKRVEQEISQLWKFVE